MYANEIPENKTAVSRARERKKCIHTRARARTMTMIVRKMPNVVKRITIDSEGIKFIIVPGSTTTTPARVKSIPCK